MLVAWSYPVERKEALHRAEEPGRAPLFRQRSTGSFASLMPGESREGKYILNMADMEITGGAFSHLPRSQLSQD